MIKKERYTLHQNGNYHTVIDEEENVPLIMIEFEENEFPVYACFHRIIDLLNEKEEQIKELEARNKRQYYSLKKIFDLMYARDWKALESIVEDWEEFDKLLQEIHWCFEKENGDAE